MVILQMKNTLFLMGRGIEGAGNTRISIELYEHFKKIGGNVKIVANSEKKWPRKDAHENEIELHNFAKHEFNESGFDTIMVMSVPAKKFTAEGHENFTSYLEREKLKGSKIVYLQCDHSIHSIARNYYADPNFTKRFLDSVDLILTHTRENDFSAKFLPKRYPDRTIEILPGILSAADFDGIKKAEWKERVPKSVRFIGRGAGWKGWEHVVNWHRDSLHKRGYTLQVEGIEMSIGVAQFLLKDIKLDRSPKDGISPKYTKEDMLEVRKNLEDRSLGAQIYPPYKREEALERMRYTRFAAFFTYLGAHTGGMLEITFHECIATKTVTIIRKELYDCAVLNDGTYLREHKPEDIGLVVIDLENPKDAEDLLDRLDESESLYTEYADKAYNFFSKRFNREEFGDFVYSRVNS